MACSIYGQELVEYAVNYPVNTATPIEGSLDWSIFDKKLDNSYFLPLFSISKVDRRAVFLRLYYIDSTVDAGFIDGQRA